MMNRPPAQQFAEEVMRVAGRRHACMDAVLRQALGSGRLGRVQRVRRDAHAPERRCILHREGACLSG